MLNMDSNQEVLNKFAEVSKGISDQILKINGSIKNYDENYKRIRFNSDIALPLNTPIKFHALTIVIRRTIEKDDKYYPEIYLEDALFEL